jgi:prealbumin domain-containing protein
MAAPQKWLRLLIVPVTLVALLAVPGTAARTPRSFGVELNQCRSGGSVGARFGRGPCIDYAQGNNPGWSNGALNETQSLYRMNDFVPFRAVITDLTPGDQYVIRLGYDAVVSGLHAYDYVGSYNASEYPRGLLQPPENPPPNRGVVPCGGVSGTEGAHACGPGPEPGRPSRRLIPLDRNTHFPPALGGRQLRGVFSAWGGTLHRAHYFHCTSPQPCGPIGLPGQTSYVPREIDVPFTANGPTVVLAWGGHLASSVDWGVGRTYWEEGSGCSVHMRVVGLGSPGSVLPPGGNHDRCIQPSAIAGPPTLTTAVAPTSVSVNDRVTDTATLTGPSGLPSGRVEFFVCGPAASPPNCSTGGTVVGTDGVVDVPQGSTTGQASIQFTPTAAGAYCFRVEYRPSGTAPYSPAEHTNTGDECFVAVTARLTVTKVCDPANDPGLFDFLVSGAPFGAPDVPCGGSRGPTETPPGTHTVAETAGTGTSLGDYTTTFGGNCAGGSITLAPGDDEVCAITNTRITPPLPPPAASLTLTKVCVPANDSSLFEFRVDGAPVANLRCGQSTAAPVEVAPGSHAVSEAGVPPTSSADYTTAISNDCAADGSITLAPGQAASCTITNTLIPRPTTLRVDKVCVPPGDNGRFNLTINGSVAGTGRDVGCRGTTGAVPVTPGTHRVGETGAGGTRLTNYTSSVGGDCAANGTITIVAGQQATCVITNVRAPLRPPGLCYRLTVARRMVSVGSRVPIVAHVHLGRRPVRGVRVYLVGPRLSTVRTTGPLGRAFFVLDLQRPGILMLRIRRPFLCPGPHPHRIGILGVSQPSLTG